LEEAGFVNAFSTRLGGVSLLPQAALNLTNFKGDTRENVAENRRAYAARNRRKSVQLFRLGQQSVKEGLLLSRIL